MNILLPGEKIMNDVNIKRQKVLYQCGGICT